VNFVADESLDDPLVLHLRKAGHTVWSVAEMTPGISDDIVLKLANQSFTVIQPGVVRIRRME
jgi:Domain of unknown function (DUF5615)